MSDRDVPAWYVRRIAVPSSFWLTDFVADDTADGRTADGANCAAVRKEGAPDGTGSGANSGILVLPGHPGTSPQADQHCRGNGAEYEFLLPVHKHSYSWCGVFGSDTSASRAETPIFAKGSLHSSIAHWDGLDMSRIFALTL
jgi:hypothetical protein